MDLNTLYNYLESQVDNGMLTLSSTDPNLEPELSGFLAVSPLTTITIDVGEGGIDLNGDILEIYGTSTEEWPIQGMKNIAVSMENVRLTLVGNNDTKVNAECRGRLPIGSNTGAVNLTSVSLELGTWNLVLLEDVEAVAVTDLQALPGFGQQPFQLPDNVPIFNDQVTLNAPDLSIRYYPQVYDSFNYEAHLLDPTATWTIVPGVFDLQGLAYKVRYFGNSLTLSVGAYYQIGSVKTEIGIKAGAGPNWEAYIVPAEGDTFPGLNDLANLIGGSSMDNTLDTGMDDLGFGIPQFDAAITSITLNFNWDTGALNYLKVASVLVLNGYSYHATFEFPNLKINAWLDASTPISIPDLFQSFGLPTVGIPDHLSIVSMYMIANVSEATYGMDITIQDTTDHWTIGPITMSELKFNIGYANEEATGGIYAKFLLSQVPLFLSAAYRGSTQGWVFMGGTDDGTGLTMGEAIADLVGKFGVTTPEAISSMTLDSLQFSYQTGTENFDFSFDSSLVIQDAPIKIKPAVKIVNVGTPENPEYSDTYSGVFHITSLDFVLAFNQTGSDDLFIASYSHDEEQKAFLIADLVAYISPELSEIIPKSLEVDLKDVLFAYGDGLGDGNVKKWTVAMDLSASFNLSDIPLIGEVLPADQSVGFDNLKIQYSNDAFTSEDVSKINSLLSESGSQAMPLPADGFSSGLNTTATMNFGLFPAVLDQDLSGFASNGPQAPPAEGAGLAQPAYSSATWYSLQKSIGPIFFNRVGVDYSDGTLFFLLDAKLTIAGLSVNLQGAGFGSPLSNFVPTFQLSGIGIEYKSPGLEIGGGLMVVDPPPDGVEFLFDGDVILKVGAFSIGAIGSYAQLSTGQPSLFVFANLGVPIGPIPAFFITGISAGFGYNRDVIIPNLNNVTDFPLIALANDEPGMPTDMEDVLAILEGKEAGPSGTTQEWIVPMLNSYWLSFGLQFNTYELIQSNAMVVAKFGNDFELAMIGISKMSLPPLVESPYVYVELQLLADWRPDDGFFGISATLSTTSFLLDQNCHLTGGFAFYVWYDGPHNGQLVLSIGGYHPDFDVPAYYPVLPRIGIDWPISSLVNMTGNAYFALTPGSIMTGGGLNINFHDGNLKAWFTAQADMLIAFQPFHFDVKVAVSVGVSYKLDTFLTTQTLTAELGANLHLTGPPTSGTVYVDWYIISFSIAFGPPQNQPPQVPLTWAEFQDLLPEGAENTLSINSGLDQTMSNGNWEVRADEAVFTAKSAIPAQWLYHNGNVVINDDGPFDVSIRPMNETEVVSILTVDVYLDQGGNYQLQSLDGWTLEPIYSSMPSTLWGEPLVINGEFALNPVVPSNDTVSNTPIGVKLVAPQPSVGYSPGDFPFANLEFLYLQPDGLIPISPTANPASQFTGTPDNTSVGDIAKIMDNPAEANRNAIFTDLSGAGLYNGSNGSLNNLVTNIDSSYTDSPMETSN